MKLYELSDQYRVDVARLADLDLPPEVVLDTIEGMQGAVQDKIKAVLIVAMEMEGEAKVRSEHAKRMAESAKATAARADALRSYAQITIQNCGLVPPLRFPEFSVALQKNPASCEITDENKLPAEFKFFDIGLRIEGDTSVAVVEAISKAVGNKLAGDIVCDGGVNKRAVLEALKAEKLVPGAELNPPYYRVVVK